MTEEEVRNGLLDLKSPKDQCLCFIRTISNIDLQHHKVWRFIDMNGKTLNTTAQAQLDTLKNDRIPQKLNSANVYRYQIDWSDDGVNESAHAEYLAKFCQDFEAAVITLVDRAAFKLNASADGTFSESLEHAHTCISKCAQFLGREDILNEIQNHVAGSSREPFVIHGRSGCGKTSVMAKAASMVGVQSYY